MKKWPHAPMCNLRLFLGWSWVLLVSLLAACLKPPEDLVCEPIAIFEALEPEQDAGAAPFSVERLGAEMKGALDKPTLIAFTRNNGTIIYWQAFGHMEFTSEVVYSPSEGLARSPEFPSEVYPIKFLDGKAKRLRLGYDSKVCRKPDANGGYSFCKYSEERVPLVADMTCRRQPAEPPRTPRPVPSRDRGTNR